MNNKIIAFNDGGKTWEREISIGTCTMISGKEELVLKICCPIKTVSFTDMRTFRDEYNDKGNLL